MQKTDGFQHYLAPDATMKSKESDARRAPRRLRMAACLLAAFTGMVFASVPGEAKTFRWAYQSEVATADPQALRDTFTRSFLESIMDPLVRFNDQLKTEPALAERWEIVEPKVWRFHLRRNVRFSNGNAFNADDVVFTYKRGSHPRSPFRGTLQTIEDIRKVDDYTIDFILRAPYPILDRDLTNMLIMDKEWVESHGAGEPVDPSKGTGSYLNTNAIGTGAFVLKSMEPSGRIVLTPNPNTWDKPKHNLTEVIFTPIKSNATRVAALLSGEIDMMYPTPLQDVDRINGTKGFRVLQGPALRAIILGMNQQSDELSSSDIKGRNPLKDVRVRKAIYQAIDIETIKDRVMRGQATLSGLIMASVINGYDTSLEKRFPYSQSESKRLLAEAGYPNGFSITLDCPNDQYVNDERVCLAITTMLNQVGIRVKLNAQTKALHFDKMLSGNSDFYLFGWAGIPTIDAYNFLSTVMHSPKGNLGTWNPKGYSNARVDELTTLVQSENDPAKRQQYISEALRIHKEEVGHIPVHTQALAWALRDGVTLAQTADDVLRLRYVRVD